MEERQLSAEPSLQSKPVEKKAKKKRVMPKLQILESHAKPEGDERRDLMKDSSDENGGGG